MSPISSAALQPDNFDITEKLRRELAFTQQQLKYFAQDFRQLRSKAAEQEAALRLAVDQANIYAQELNGVLASERRKSVALHEAHLQTVRGLTRAARFRDDETGLHLERIAHYVRLMSVELALSEAAAQGYSIASTLHDIGKIAIPDAVLYKRSSLTDAERIVINRHTIIGAQLLSGGTSPQLILGREIALTHHENWDGSGYPRGLQGREIPLGGRLVRLADQYDALRSERPYKPPLTHEKSYRIIAEGDGRTKPSHFDPELLDIFWKHEAAFKDIFDGSYLNPSPTETDTQRPAS